MSVHNVSYAIQNNSKCVQAQEKEQFFTNLEHRIPILISNQRQTLGLVDFWKNRDHGCRRLLGRKQWIFFWPTRCLEILTKTPIEEDGWATAYVGFLLTVSSILMHMQSASTLTDNTPSLSLAHFCFCPSCCWILYIRFLDLALIFSWSWSWAFPWSSLILSLYLFLIESVHGWYLLIQ